MPELYTCAYDSQYCAVAMVSLTYGFMTSVIVEAPVRQVQE